jgi:cysteinyl-tRNA synthetase
MLITLKNKGLQGVILRAAWGPRRVTTRRRYGKVESAYPSEVTASLSLWFNWLRRGLKQWAYGEVSIVIPQTKATARIRSAIATSDIVTKTPVLSELDIKELQERREYLRLIRNFKEADAIREKLEAAGVVVKDTPISKKN